MGGGVCAEKIIEKIGRNLRERVSLRRTEAGRQLAVIEYAISAAQDRFLIAENIERKSDTRAEIVFVHVVDLLPDRRIVQRSQIEILEQAVFFAADRAHLVAQAEIQRKRGWAFQSSLTKNEKFSLA